MLNWLKNRMPARPKWATNLPAWAWYLILATTGVGAAFGLWPSATPPDEIPFVTGWVKDQDAVAKVVSQLPIPTFQGTPACAAAEDGPEDVFLWDACKAVTGDILPARDQGSVGSCVAFGTAAAIEHLQCIQIVRALHAGQPPPQYRDLSQEVIYGGSRVEIGGGRISGDGSIGAWAAQFVRNYGVVPRAEYEAADLRKYSERLCRELGDRGVPDSLETVAKLSPVKTITQVKSWDDVRKAIKNGYPIAVCSDQGFSLQRDAEGFAAPRGQWMHCMAIVGVKGGNRPGGFILNSWGPDRHKGPRGAGNPSPAGFWADAAVIDRMVRQGDSWAFSDAVGFPARKINWFAMPAPSVLGAKLDPVGANENEAGKNPVGCGHNANAGDAGDGVPPCPSARRIGTGLCDCGCDCGCVGGGACVCRGAGRIPAFAARAGNTPRRAPDDLLSLDFWANRSVSRELPRR